MKVITNNPVIVNGTNFSNDDLAYSGKDFEYTSDDFYSNGEGEGEAAGMSSDSKAAIAQAGQAVVGNLVTALATRPKKPLSDAEQRCGKKPKVGKKKIADWKKCANSAPAAAPVLPILPPTAEDTKKPMSKGLKIGLIAGSVVLVAIIGFVIYKKSKKK